MKPCKHKTVEISEHIINVKTYHFIENTLVERSASGKPTVRTFEAICHRCGMRKIYRYGPGQFGPHSTPRWLYERMEDVVCQDWGQQPAPVMARKEQNAQM